MKKIISMILLAMLVLSLATVGSAVTMTSAQLDAADQVFVMSSEDSEDIIVNAVAEDGVIKVTYDSSVLEAAEDAQATIIIFNATENETPSAGNMIQIDQFEFDPEDTTYEYAYEAEEGQIIVVMMGGTDIDKPGSVTFEAGPGYVVGDIFGDGIGMDDAMAVLKYTVSRTVNGQPATEDFIKVADFNGDGKVTIVDAIMIAYSTL